VSKFGAPIRCLNVAGTWLMSVHGDAEPVSMIVDMVPGSVAGIITLVLNVTGAGVGDDVLVCFM
jgi:hypothetical protein